MKIDKLKIDANEYNNPSSKELLLILLVALLGTSVFSIIFYYTIPNDALASCLGSLVSIICYYLIIGKDKFISILKKFKYLKTWIIGLSLGVILVAINFGLTHIVTLLTNNSSANEIGVSSMILTNKFWGSLYVILFAPFIEEFAYRFGLFGYFKKYNRILAYIVSGIVFGLLHFTSSFNSDINLMTEILSLVIYCICGLILCFIYDKSNSLSTSILAHILNNVVALIILFI